MQWPKYRCCHSRAGLLIVAVSVSIFVEAGPKLEEVVVTAQRRAQSTQDVPVAITGLTGDSIEKFGIESANDIGAQVPNMQVAGPYGDVQPIFTIRGVSQSDYNSNQASPIGVYVDEAYQPAVYSHGANFFDLERLEVLRGPQGTLYGKNTTGGAINIITRTPVIDEEFEGRVKVGAGSFRATNVEAAVEGTLISSVLAARFAAFAKRDDGYQENPLNNQNGAQTDAKGARLTLNWNINDNSRAILKISRGENDAITTQVRNEPGVDVRNTQTGPGDSNGFIDYSGYSRPSRDLDFHEVESNKVGALVTQNDSVNLKVSYDFDEFSVVSVSAYGDAQYSQSANTDGSPTRLLEIDWSNDTVSYSQDLRFVSDFDGWMNVIIGAYFGHEQLGQKNLYSLFEDLPDQRVVEENGEAAGLAPFLLDFGILDNRMRTEKDSTALYGQFRLDISDKMGIDFGLRYTVDKNDQTYYNTSRLDYDGTPRGSYVPGNTSGRDEAFTPVTASPEQVELCLQNLASCAVAPGYTDGPYTLESQPALSATEREWTGKLGVDYTFNDDLMMYGAYSRGYRSGSYNGGIYYLERDIDDAYARPEFIDAYEAGIKADLFDGQLRINAAAFLYDYTDQQFVNVVGISVFLENAGASEIMGMEAEIQFQATDTLSFQFGFGLLETEFSELSLADTTTFSDVEDQVDLSGNELISAPNFNANLSVDWDIISTDYGYLTTNANVTYQSQQWFSAYNDKAEYGASQQEAYYLSNARLSWYSTDDSFSVSAWVKNLEDKEYDFYAIDIQASFGFTYFIAGAPRTYGLDVTYRF